MPKVAVVNVRAVLKENARAKMLQAELDEALKPHKVKAVTLTKEIDALHYGDLVRREAKTKEWEAVNAEILRLIEEKHKDKLPAVWNEVNGGIEAVAKAYGFQLVLGYGNPDDPELSKLMSVKGSMLRSTDMGATVLPYVHGSIDITPVVIKTLAR